MTEDTAQPPALVGTFIHTLDLPSGGGVVLRDPLELREKDRRAVLEHIETPDQRMRAALDFVDGIIAMLVESWTIPYLPGAPIPKVDLSVLGELTVRDKMALDEAIEPAREVLFPPKDTADNAMEPGSPTRPASA